MHSECDRVLAIDIGTSSVRAMVFGADGTIRARSQIQYPTVRPRPFFEEQDPDLVRTETFRAVRECLADTGAVPARIGAVSFSSQMYGIFPVDASGKPMTFNVLWSDGRSGRQAAALKGESSPGKLYPSTGCPANSIYPIAKLLWFAEERPELFLGAAKFVSIKEYVIRLLVEDWVVDHSMASATGLFDIERRDWHPDALGATGLDRSKLSRPVAGDEALPFKNTGLAVEWGLSESVKIFLGGGDGPLANLGSGAFPVGAVNIDLGTSGAARVVVDKPTVDDRGSLWCYCLDSAHWTYGGIVTNVGNAYQWLASNVVGFFAGASTADVLARLDSYADSIEPGSGGVLFLPYLRKARSPHWDDRLTGLIYGLGPEHDVRHIARALLEAIAYDIASIVELMSARVELIPGIILTGGLSKNPLMAQLLADVLGRKISVPSCGEGSIAGAAIIALRGIGLISGLRFNGDVSRTFTEFVPNAAYSRIYSDLRAEYEELVSRSADLGNAIESLRGKKPGDHKK